MFEHYCVKWDDQALKVDKTSLTGVRVIEDASKLCDNECSLWELCAPDELSNICDDAWKFDAKGFLIGLAIALLTIVALVLFCKYCLGGDKDDEFKRIK